MKKILIILLVFLSITAFSQNNSAEDYFNQGVNAYNLKDYKKADSLFTISAKLEPNKDTYFNLGATKNMIGDHCGFCENMYKAFIYGDVNAEDLYFKNCVKDDTIFYPKKNGANVFYYCIYSNQYCIKNKSFYLHKEYEQNGEKNHESFYLDTNQISTDKIISGDFDIEKIFDDSTIYVVVDEMPTFPGGNDFCIKFICNNIIYPVYAKEHNIQGIVYTTFIVEKDGSLTDIKIYKGIGGGCDEESIRVIKLMPKWKPGKHKGKEVRVKFFLPVKFIVQQ